MIGIFAILLVLCLGVSRLALQRYEDALRRAEKERAPTAHTGAEIARMFLDSEGAQDVQIIEHRSVVTNCFDPARRRLFLDPAVAGGTTMAAWALALHEAAHATQTGEALGELKWRQSVIRMTRYGPMFTGILAAVLMVLKVMPVRMALMALVAVCGVLVLLNLGTAALEYNANARLRRFLDQHLDRKPEARERLDHYLSRVAPRELGDLLRSPRYFFLSAIPGTSKLRPR